MKQLSLLFLWVVGFSVCGFAQSSAPTLSLEKKNATLVAQHELDGIEKQQKDLTLQFQQLQAQAQTRMNDLNEKHKVAQAKLDAAIAADKSGVDEKAWKFDAETLSFSAVPAPVAPAPPLPNGR